MDIVVCTRVVCDAAARVEIGRDGLGIVEDVPWIINPYDEFALEEAIRLKEALGGRVTVLSASPGPTDELLKKTIAMGADEAVSIKSPRLGQNDDMAFARALASAIKAVPFDIILCGKETADTNSGLTGAALAALLSIPLVSSITKLTISPDKKTAAATRDVPGGTEVVECALPALFTAARGLNIPRLPTLPGIMKAKKASVKVFEAALDGPAPKRLGLTYPLSKRKGLILKGELGAQVKEALRFLKDEVKAI